MYSATKLARTAATISHFLTVRQSTFKSFSTTSLLRAAESEKPFFNVSTLDDFKRSPAFEKISRSPDAVLAIQKLVKVMEKQGALQLGLVRAYLTSKSCLGVDLSSGKPPSMIQMSKLFMNSEFRKGAEELVEELKKTGINVVDSKVCGQGYIFSAVSGS